MKACIPYDSLRKEPTRKIRKACCKQTRRFTEKKSMMISLIILCLLVVVFHASAQDIVPSQIKSVTLFLNQALVTREANVKVNKGLNEILIDIEAFQVDSESVGGFDESLPACEDYDLWLRIGCRYPVPLIAQQLVVKRGGHDDQLSRTPGLDKYRIMALKKNLEIGNLTSSQYRKTVDKLKEKCRVYSDGCIKRGKEEEGNCFKNLAERFS